MLYQEKVRLLKSMTLLSHMPERSFKAVAEFLKPRAVAEGAIIFEEGARGMSIYFVATGRVSIFKQSTCGAVKELAVLGPGEFFGEMALIDNVPRSASARAIGPSVVFELFRDDLARWAKTSPQQAVQFFAGLSQVQSKRLRRTSRQLTLHFDIEDLLAESQAGEPEFLADVLERVVAHLGTDWSAAAYLSEDGTTPKRVVSQGQFPFSEFHLNGLPDMETCGNWLDDDIFQAELTRKGKALGRLLFKAPTKLVRAERDDLAMTLTAVCNPITTGLEIIRTSRQHQSA